jgi:lipopolysaccharide transport system ATP-binding protein
MKENIAIQVENLSKVFSLRQKQVDENGESSNLLWALKDVSFKIKKGESVGIVGSNGSGKSTLLKILAGITKPTSGKVTIRGKIGSILEIGAGFHPDLSGRENIFLNGQIHGFTKKEVESKFDEILAFSGIEKFIDELVKNYSQGMYLRLAFSIMVHLDFDIYLLDEVISVGDLEFRQNCFDKLNEINLSKFKTFLIISHDLSEIYKICRRAYFLNFGNISQGGELNEAFLFYSKSNFVKKPKIPFFINNCEVNVLDETNKSRVIFDNTEVIFLEIKNQFNFPCENIEFGIKVIDRFNNVVLNLSPKLQKSYFRQFDFRDFSIFKVKLPAFFFSESFFYIDIIYFTQDGLIGEITHVGHFQVLLNNSFKMNVDLGLNGPLMPFYEWELIK